MKRSRPVLVASVVASALLGAVTQVRADDAAPANDREKKLEQKVEDLQKQLDDVNRRLSETGSNAAGDELSSRVSELEKVSHKDADGLFGYWNNGIRMDSASGAFKLKMGGRIQSDWSMFHHTSGAVDHLASTPIQTPIKSGEEFRRARLYMGGTIYTNVDFMAEYDFAGGTVAARNVWIALNHLPFRLQVGNMKEPTGTEQLTDDLYIPFLERSAGNNAFASDYHAGFMASDTICDMAVWQLGVFRPSGANGNYNVNTPGSSSGNGDYDIVGRMAGRPWMVDETQFLNVGGSYAFRTPMNDTAQYKATPELHLVPAFVDTGSFTASNAQTVELDAGLVSGPAWAYADYWWTTLNQTGASNPHVTAWSAAVGWFVTGESKPYQASNSTFGRVKPKSNFDGNGGSGAFEVVARYSQIDLNSRSLDGGKMDIFTLGANWYLNPNTRFMLDWVHARQREVGFWINGIEVRFQIDF